MMKFCMEDDLKMNTTSKWRRPQNKDDLKNEYDLKNEDNLKRKDNLKNDDELKN